MAKIHLISTTYLPVWLPRSVVALWVLVFSLPLFVFTADAPGAGLRKLRDTLFTCAGTGISRAS